jgi:hypothetical protein
VLQRTAETERSAIAVSTTETSGIGERRASITGRQTTVGSMKSKEQKKPIESQAIDYECGQCEDSPRSVSTYKILLQGY